MSRFTGRGGILTGGSLQASSSPPTTLSWGGRTTGWCKGARECHRAHVPLRVRGFVWQEKRKSQATGFSM